MTDPNVEAGGEKARQIKARAVIAGDLYREGRITRPECFRLEMDAALGYDSGPIAYEANTEYADLRAEENEV